LAYESSQSTEDARTAKFSMKMDAGQQTIKGKGEGRYAGEDTAMAMSMTMAQGFEMKVRVIDDTYYMQLPERLQKQMGNGKPWVKLSLDGDSKFGQMIGKSLKQSVNSSDPTKMLETLQKGGEITKKEATSDGSHYWVDVDVTAMMKQTQSSEVMKQLPGKFEKKLDGVTLPTRIWMNDDLLPTKITMEMSEMGKAMQQGKQGKPSVTMGTMVMKYYDWGDPVDIQKPPKDKVGTFEMPDLGGMGGTQTMPN